MKLKTGQKCAFGFGAFGKDIVYMLISSYLLYYYNVVLGMSSVFIGTVMMAALGALPYRLPEGVYELAAEGVVEGNGHPVFQS